MDFMDSSSEDEQVEEGVNLNVEGEGDVNGDGQQEGQGDFKQNEDMAYSLKGGNGTKLNDNEGTTTKSGRSIKLLQLPLEISPIPKRRGTSKKRGALLTQARKNKIISYKQRTPRGQVGTGGWIQGLLHFMDDSSVKMADIKRWIRAPDYKWIWEDGRGNEVDEDEEKENGRMDQEEVDEEEIHEGGSGQGIGNMQNGGFEHHGVPPPDFAPLPPPLQPVVGAANQNASYCLTYKIFDLLLKQSYQSLEKPETRASPNPIDEELKELYRQREQINEHQED